MGDHCAPDPGAAARVAGIGTDMREVMNAVRYVLRRRQLPKDFPNRAPRVYNCF